MKRLSKAMLMFMMMLALAGNALASEVSMKLNADARFYKSASTSSESVKIEKGTKVKLKDTDDDWARVTWKGKTGYVKLKYLNAGKRASAYVSKDTYIYSSASHSSSRKAISAGSKVYVVGKSGDYYRIQNASGSVTCYIDEDCLSESRPSSGSSDSSGSSGSSDWKSKVVKMNWFDGGSRVLKKGHYGYIYDIDTGLTVRIKRMGGSNHADCEPATKADTAKLKKIAGGSFSWDSQAVILRVGSKYVACAINTQPHGDQTISDNGYPGQFCLHMTGSKTHESDSINESHQKAINRAYNWAH